MSWDVYLGRADNPPGTRTAQIREDDEPSSPGSGPDGTDRFIQELDTIWPGHGPFAVWPPGPSEDGRLVVSLLIGETASTLAIVIQLAKHFGFEVYDPQSESYY